MSEAAEIIGISRATLWRWISEGRIERRYLLTTGTQHRIARVWCEGRHLVPTASASAASPAAAVVSFPAVTYRIQA